MDSIAIRLGGTGALVWTASAPRGIFRFGKGEAGFGALEDLESILMEHRWDKSWGGGITVPEGIFYGVRQG